MLKEIKTKVNEERVVEEMEVVVPVVEKSDARATNSVITSLSAIATWAVLSLLLL